MTHGTIARIASTPPDHRPDLPQFDTARDDSEEIAVLVVNGEIDLHTAPRFEGALRPLQHRGTAVVDLRETAFIDSSGLRALLTATEALQGRLHIACTPAGPVSRLARMTNTDAVLKLYPTRELALAAARAG